MSNHVLLNQNCEKISVSNCKKLFFSNLDDATCYMLQKHIQDMDDAMIDVLHLHEAKPVYNTDYFYCSHYQEIGDKAQGTCGKMCDHYAPRNGKSGRCKQCKNTYEQTENTYTLIKKPYNLFLDDWRIPADCAKYMYRRGADCTIYSKQWLIVRSHGQFVNAIKNLGIPKHISFDYDLADVLQLKEQLPIEQWFDVEKNREYNGADCATWLLNYCKQNNLSLPQYLIHSTNDDGCELIKQILLSI